MLQDNWDSMINSLDTIFKNLGDAAAENFRYFCTNSGKGKSINADFMTCFETILNVLDPLQISLDAIINACSSYDSRFCKSNGYRSIIFVVWKCVRKLLDVVVEIQDNRQRLFFRSFHSYMELDSYTQVLSRLFTMVQFAVMLVDMCQPGILFPDCKQNEEYILALLDDFESINRESFYGRTFGFQFASSLSQSLNVIGVAMAAYGDGFDRHSHAGYRALYSFLHSGKYVVDPELRAKRIVHLTQNVSVDFCKAFWSLTERHGIQHVPLLLCPALEINTEFKVSAEPIMFKRENGDLFRVALESKNHVMQKIDAHLLSLLWRQGQNVNEGQSQFKVGTRPHPKSNGLIFHCHGGGFVAQSSKSHELYLRYWAKELQAPVLSINYSLSPASVFPEALNECFYMYIWALKNADKLGTTAEKICFAGDSAGANLVVALCLKAIEENIRLPDGIAVAYPPFRVQFIPSPSRILSLMDPLLPIGILRECLESYSGIFHKNVRCDSSAKRRKIRTPYLGENYNPFDLDLGELRHHRYPVMKSYSDSNLLASNIKSKRSLKQALCGFSSFRKTTFFHDSQEEDLFLYSEQSEPIRDNTDTASIDSSNSGLQMHYIEDNPLPCCSCGRARYNLKLVNVGEGDKRLGDGQWCDCTSIQQDSVKLNPVTLDCMDEDIRDKNVVNQITNCSTLSKSMRRRARSKTLTGMVHKSFSEGDLAKFKRSLSYPRVKERKNSPVPYETQKSSKEVAPEERTNSNSDEAEGIILPRAFSVSYSKTSDSCHIFSEKPNYDYCGSRNDSLHKDAVKDNADDDFPVKEFKSSPNESLLHIPLDPLMSPLFASDNVLKKLPHVSIVASALDPLLDDSVEFTKRLEDLGKDVELYVIEDLPHGFLQFSVISGEAREACDLMIACMKKILGFGMQRIQSSPS